MNLQLKSKIALVTGSTAGIGYAIAKRLLEEGAEVIITGRTQPRIDEAVAQLSAEVPGAVVRGVAVDFKQKEEINNLLEQVPEVDILVNNVGVFGFQEFAQISDEEWYALFEVNVMSGIRLSQRYLPLLLKKNWGRIIFISSESALQTPPDMIHYGVTKTAQLAVARGLAELTRGTAVTVNSVLPGPTLSEGVKNVLTGMAAHAKQTLEQVEEEFIRSVRPTSILQRLATTEEIANMVTYLASPLSSATNGTAVRVDGGVTKTVV